MTKTELLQFAERTESLCKRVIGQMSPGNDRNSIDNLRQDALAVQTFLMNDKSDLDLALDGIAELIGR